MPILSYQALGYPNWGIGPVFDLGPVRTVPSLATILQGGNMCGHRLKRRGERGAVAVEFALVVPILLVLFFGIVNFGIALAQQLSLGNSARQAARFAVVDVEGRTCGQIEAEARAAAETIGMKPADPTYALMGATGTCERPCAGATATTDLTVTMTYRSEFVVPIPIPGVPNGLDIEGEGVFRCEYN